MTSSPETQDEPAAQPDAAGDVRRWLLENHRGVLGTLSSGGQQEGWPFLSVVPFALDARGQPLLQLADIAEHTRNAKADARTSLLVQEDTEDGDPQRGWRITLLGKLARVTADETEEVLARFVERVPAAHGYAQQHSFNLYRLQLERVRYIGGFGKICWVNAEAVLRDPLGAGLAEAAPGAITHMNADHGSSLLAMCEGQYGFKPERAELVSVDRTGLVVRALNPDRLVHFSFGKEIDAPSLRQEVIGVLARSRRARAS